jgi:hypothetical protein
MIAADMPFMPASSSTPYSHTSATSSFRSFSAT